MIKCFHIKIALFTAALVALSIGSFAQTGVSINSTGTAPDADAILDISSRTEGVLLPRMTTNDRTTVLTPNANGDYGLIVFDTDTKSYWYWDGLAWQELPSVANAGNTLDQAYDQGGAGAGRIINASDGNVEITGAGFLTVASNIGIGAGTPAEKLHVEGEALLDLYGQGDASGLFFREGFTNANKYNLGLLIHDDGDSSPDALDIAAFDGIYFNTGSNTRNPRMVVQSDGNVRVNNLADPDGAVVTSNSTGELGKTSLTGDATDVFLGNGTFGSSSAFSDHDWYQTLSTNTPTAVTDWIYTNGRVGIGVGAATNPAAPLEVAASGSGNPANNSIMANNPNNSAGNDAIITTRVAGSSAGDPFFSLDISGEAGWSMGIDNDHDNRFKIAPSWNNLSAGTAMTIQTNGNVGVGTTSPSQKLQINVNNNGLNIPLLLRNENGTEGGNMVGLGFINEGGGDWAKGAIVHERQSNFGRGDMHFLLDNTGDNSAVTLADAKMTILGNGNVGVGTTGPAQKLQANGIVRSFGSHIIDIDGAHGSGPRIALGSTSNPYAFMNIGAYNGINNLETTTRDFRIGSNAATNAVYVKASDGNVGIGTAGPAQKLEVNGGARITSLAGGGDKIVYANNNGDLYGSTGLPANDADYIWNQNASDQGANFRINGTGEASLYRLRSSDGEKIQLTSAGASGSKIRHTTGWSVDYHAGPGTGGETGAHRFFTTNGSYLERMRILANGNVGIGTVAPASIFHISTSQTGNVSKLHNTSLGNGSLVGHEFGKNNNTNNMVEFRYNHVNDGNSANWVNLGLWGNANTLNVLGSGNVGIGTTSPDHKLEINGHLELQYDNQDNKIRFHDPNDVWYSMGTDRSDGGKFKINNGGNIGDNAHFTMLSNGNVGIGTTNPTYHLHVSGRLKTTGINETSDARLKKDIKPINNALKNVLQMEGVTYNWRKNKFPEMNLSDDSQHGLIAQELEKIIPELVLTDSEGWKSIEYTHLVPVLIEAIKEQQNIIEGQKTLMNSQAAEIKDLNLKAANNTIKIDAVLQQLNGYSNK